MNRHDGLRHEVPTDVQRITQVLADLRYPAAKWQVLAEADHYGADSTSRAQLWALPVDTYHDLGGVLVALGLRRDRRPDGQGRPVPRGLPQPRP